MHLLKAFEHLPVCLPCAGATQGSSRLNRFIFHLRDGLVQEAWDASMWRAMKRDEKDEEVRRKAEQDGKARQLDDGEKGAGA